MPPPIRGLSLTFFLIPFTGSSLSPRFIAWLILPNPLSIRGGCAKRPSFFAPPYTYDFSFQSRAVTRNDYPADSVITRAHMGKEGRQKPNRERPGQNPGSGEFLPEFFG
jgi:hypothetical protein